MDNNRSATLEAAFGANHVTNVFAHYYAFVQEYAEATKRYLGSDGEHISIVANEMLSYEVIISTYLDILRHKEFHFTAPNSTKSDAVKRAAYTAKWTLRYRPLVFIEQESSKASALHQQVALMNEGLAIDWGMLCIEIEQGLDGIKLRRTTRTDLLYYMHFREISGDGFQAIFQIIKDLSKAQKENPVVEFAVA